MGRNGYVKDLPQHCRELGYHIFLQEPFELDLLDIVKIVETYVRDIKPILYTHHSGDLNVEHQITYKAVMTVTRPMGDYSVQEIYGFETVSSTEWNFSNMESGFYPQKYVDITDTFDAKCEAMQEYKSELCIFLCQRSIKMLESLAEVRGEQ